MTTLERLCAVCQDNLTVTNASTHELQCGHVFHSGCIIEWFRRGENSCPVCRDTGALSSGSSTTSGGDDSSRISSEEDTLTLINNLEHFRMHSSRSEVARLVRVSLASARRNYNVRSRSMQRLRVRANRFIKAIDEANDAKYKANLFLQTHSGPLLNGVKRYNALVRMWGIRERRLRDAALDLYMEHSID